ncbi:WXG100 family type VII secretion target [Nocardia cyriacigeorgica]|uniref:WXG100 family type VII secretion target n=1 Tax=Nocardia cyriacigeorgica TaxID=135487 RepID=A0A5R8P4C4_9NOCA|nr:WXG100 family type VII secretion target [Nocardia cyriacigeorgica]MBF6093978.1 WXG100 family type VII secretion target [Nocardia cyriacigeorgica]TLF72725.1 hypothetical protein FEK34_28740 [Nocardia cyriacigeorgica]TLF92377.1 hypothetical protein FEK35_30595 [Nocardia cyriacigeorgica]
MSDEVGFSPEQLQAGIDRLNSLHTTLVDAASAIDRAHTDLQSTWTGPAATSMNDLWRREFDTLTPLFGQLEDMAAKLAAAKTALQQQDNDNSAAVTETAPAPTPEA